MTESVKNELSDICRIIDATVDTEKIYLFGSYAYGTPTDDSDYDLCVIIPENSMRPVDAVKAIRRALLPLRMGQLQLQQSKNRYHLLHQHCQNLYYWLSRFGYLLYQLRSK